MADPRWLPAHLLQSLLDALIADGFRIAAPTLEQNAITYNEITSVDELPQGWSDHQAPGLYQLQKKPSTNPNKFFGFNVGPHSWKKYLFPPVSQLPNTNNTDNQAPAPPHSAAIPTLAILGPRACELAAIAIQDRVFLTPPTIDSQYALRRSRLFIIAVQCTTAADTCFCPSMKTGPELPSPTPSNNSTPPYDLALTELDPSPNNTPVPWPHGFLISAASTRGQTLLDRLPTQPALPEMLQASQQSIQSVRDSIQRALPTNELRNPLLERLNHPHWDNVAERCLSCANCTMVCPTCFCSSVDEVHDLTDDTILRQRRWDSCFNPDFTHTSGAPVRNSIRSRYRQWLTHKLATWFDQFDTSGCVGCGRCITWCPVGIDLTQEVATLLNTPSSGAS